MENTKTNFAFLFFSSKFICVSENSSNRDKLIMKNRFRKLLQDEYKFIDVVAVICGLNTMLTLLPELLKNIELPCNKNIFMNLRCNYQFL